MGIDVESILVFECCIKHASHVIIVNYRLLLGTCTLNEKYSKPQHTA